MNKKYDVVGVGSPLLDIIVEVDDDFLRKVGLVKGGMKLVDGEVSQGILKSLEKYSKVYASGGSAANTVAGACLLKSKGLFLGIVGKDENGDIYEREMRRTGAETRLIRHPSAATGFALTLITPDGERTFAVYLGAAEYLGQEHIPPDLIEQSAILHIEGYMLENPRLRGVAVFAMKTAKNSGTLVSLDLADAGLITRNKEVIRDIVQGYANLVFVNESEALAFTGKEVLHALHEIQSLCDTAVVKLGERGSLVKCRGKVCAIEPHPVEVINTNGAGDMYAAGFLHGMARGYDIDLVGKVASHLAGLVVASPGARLHENHHGKLEGILDFFRERQEKS